MAGPWEKYQAGGLRPLAPRPAPQATPQAPDLARKTQLESSALAQTVPLAGPKAQADLEKAQADAKMAKRAAQLGLTPEQLGDAMKSVKLLPAMERDLSTVAQIYMKDFRNQGVMSPLEYLPTPSAARLNHAAGRMRASIAGTLGLTSKQFDTPAEQQQFIMSFLPSNTNWDSDIEDKIQSLTDLVNDARKNREKFFGTKYQPFANPLKAPPPAAKPTKRGPPVIDFHDLPE